MVIDILIQITTNLDNVYSILDTLEKADHPPELTYHTALFFIDPWQIEDFCNNPRKFNNISIYLAEEHRPDNFNEHLKLKLCSTVRTISDDTVVTPDFFLEVCGIK